MEKYSKYEVGYNKVVNENEIKPDYCPKTAPYKEIRTITCQNCPIEGRCEFMTSAKVVSGEVDWEEGFSNSEIEDFDDGYTIEPIFNTDEIEKIQTIIDTASKITSLALNIKLKYYKDKELMGILKAISTNTWAVTERLRELQERAAIEEMYNFLVKNN